MTKDNAQFLINVLNMFQTTPITMTVPDAINFSKQSQELAAELQQIVDAPDEEVALELGDADGQAEAASA